MKNQLETRLKVLKSGLKQADRRRHILKFDKLTVDGEAPVWKLSRETQPKEYTKQDILKAMRAFPDATPMRARVYYRREIRALKSRLRYFE